MGDILSKMVIVFPGHQAPVVLESSPPSSSAAPGDRDDRLRRPPRDLRPAQRPVRPAV